MREQLTAHDRHARHVGDLFAFNQLERASGIPLAHEYHAAARHGCRLNATVVSRYVEQGSGCEQDGTDGRWFPRCLGGGEISGGHGFRVGHTCGQLHESDVEDIGH